MRAERRGRVFGEDRKRDGGRQRSNSLVCGAAQVCANEASTTAAQSDDLQCWEVHQTLQLSSL